MCGEAHPPTVCGIRQYDRYDSGHVHQWREQLRATTDLIATPVCESDRFGHSSRIGHRAGGARPARGKRAYERWTNGARMCLATLARTGHVPALCSSCGRGAIVGRFKLVRKAGRRTIHRTDEPRSRVRLGITLRSGCVAARLGTWLRRSPDIYVSCMHCPIPD